MQFAKFTQESFGSFVVANFPFENGFIWVRGQWWPLSENRLIHWTEDCILVYRELTKDKADTVIGRSAAA
jgi:hypothetical protein